jgi:hypothetical protein
MRLFFIEYVGEPEKREEGISPSPTKFLLIVGLQTNNYNFVGKNVNEEQN